MPKPITKSEALSLIKEGRSYYSAFVLTPILGTRDGTVIWTGGKFFLLTPNEFSMKIKDVEWRDDQPRATFEISMDADLCKEVCLSLEGEAKKIAVDYHGDVPVLYNRHWTRK